MNKNSKGKKGKLLSLLDTIFVVNGEMIAEKGEDSYAFAVNGRMGMLGAFDGCGGIGSRKYTEFGGNSGAYLAARAVSCVAMDWFSSIGEANESLTYANVDGLCADLKMQFDKKLRQLENESNTGAFMGTLAKSFPTTASVILFSNIRKSIFASFVWAGDSRGYILDEKGLCQITTDDIEGETDALLNISNDGKLTNMVSASRDYELHHKEVLCEKPMVLITASDGCFGYFSTPMEFEYMLMETLMCSESVEEWKEYLEAYIRKYTADDYTLGIAAFGYKDFVKFRKSFELRKEFLKQKYILPLEQSGTDIISSLWDEYKKTYYRGV